MSAATVPYNWSANSTRAQVWRMVYAAGPAAAKTKLLLEKLPGTTMRQLNMAVHRMREQGFMKACGWGRLVVDEDCTPPNMPTHELVSMLLPYAFEARALAWLEDIPGGVDSDVLAGLMLLDHLTTMDHMAPLVASGRVHQVVDEKRLNVRYTLAPEAQS